MKKIMLIVIFSLLSFLFIKTNIYAADLYSTCFYELNDNNKKLLGETKIYKKTDSKGKITYKEDTFVDSEIDGDKNKNNDESILNWNTAGTSYPSINKFYTAQTVYETNLTCPDYMLYVDTQGDELIFVSDKANLKGIIGEIGKLFNPKYNPVYTMVLFMNVKSTLNPGGATSGGTTSGGTTSGGATSGGTTSGGTTSGGTTSGGATSGGSTSSGTINQDVKDDCEGIFGKNSETKKLLQKILNRNIKTN